MENNALNILQALQQMYPNACCELNYHNVYELTIATILSAQTTDNAVNKVTPILFKHYPSVNDLSMALFQDVKNDIKTLGLSETKARNIIKLANEVISKYNGIIPNDFDTLITLPGVGRKTANVILSEGYKIPRIAVDTHVYRVSKRLGLSNANDPLGVEQDLIKSLPEETWSNTHLCLLFFGRYFCKAKNPNCELCKFKMICKNDKK